jgi:hypothetical protein
MQNDISVQGWSSMNPYNYSAWNANWPIEALDSIPGSAEDRQIDLNDLMPAGWRMGAQMGSGQQLVTGGINDESGWNATVPSREQYERYNLTAGSARLALNTRWKSPTGAMNETLPGRLPPPIPVGTGEVDFNDSDARQSMIYNSTGFWPSKESC